jgi:hypothetical protein
VPRSDPYLLGSNQVFVEDDILVWVTGDEVALSDMQCGHELFTQQLERYGYVLILSEISQLASIPAEVRRLHTEWSCLHQPYFSVALIGGSVLAKTLVRLVLTASQLLSRDKLTRFHYVDDPAQALAWLDLERMRLQGLVAQGSPGRGL